MNEDFVSDTYKKSVICWEDPRASLSERALWAFSEGKQGLEKFKINVLGWLEKNKDPVNDTVVELLKGSTRVLLVHIWRDHPGKYCMEKIQAVYFKKFIQ